LRKLNFKFGLFNSEIIIQDELPSSEDITCGKKFLVVCDRNTEFIANKIFTGSGTTLCVLEPGETGKSWDSVVKILKTAKEAGLDRDCLFIGIGGGIIGDLCGFAASIYMRGIRFKLISTTLLGMVDASVGGKTGINLFGIKNLAGAFYPAETVFMPLSVLNSLPDIEFNSGMAELIKTAIIGDNEFLKLVKSIDNNYDNLEPAIIKAVELKGHVVETDPNETGTARAVLNLGHTFGHALESSVGLGKITHGEAVAWGIVRACELGMALGITPLDRSMEIMQILDSFDYEINVPYPGMDIDVFMRALTSDKKIKSGKMNFIIPAQEGVKLISETEYPVLKDELGQKLIRSIVSGKTH